MFQTPFHPKDLHQDSTFSSFLNWYEWKGPVGAEERAWISDSSSQYECASQKQVAPELQPYARMTLQDNDKGNIFNGRHLDGASINYFVTKERYLKMKK